MIRHAAEVGWTPLAPREALEKRGGEERMLFRGELCEGARAVQPLADRRHGPPSHRASRGVAADHRGQPRDARLAARRAAMARRGREALPASASDRLETPGANVLQVTWEWKIKPPARKGNRADVMFVVNGLPAAIVEHKKPQRPRRHRARRRAVAALREGDARVDGRGAAFQRDASARLLVRRHLERLAALHGALEETPGKRATAPPSSRSSSRPTFCARCGTGSFSTSRTARRGKSVLRQHQRRAVERIAERCAEPDKRRGLIWHTQGSGKTFTLLSAARLILERKERFGNSTVVVVVDRTELEEQLKGWVDRLLGEMQQQDIPIWRAPIQDRAPGIAQNRQARPDPVDDPQVRGAGSKRTTPARTFTSLSTRRTARSPKTWAPT